MTCLDGSDTTVVEVVDGEEEEDLTCFDCSSDILDEVVVECEGSSFLGCGYPLSRHDGGFGVVEECGFADVFDSPAFEGCANHAEELSEVVSAWGLFDGVFIACD